MNGRIGVNHAIDNVKVLDKNILIRGDFLTCTMIFSNKIELL